MCNRPKLIKLTQIGGLAELDGGKPTTLYVDPLAITLVVRGRTAHTAREVDGVTNEIKELRGTFLSCTIIWLSTGNTAAVVETPEQVALLRERALNNDTGPRGVVA